ncbi:hypothetical protein Q8F55_008075 [Vanrija albida]|uniref:Kinesin-like protein n=1 Tax=Vanrija albida TaxID=181172 RepID=A0ABR3PVA7_9TREE
MEQFLVDNTARYADLVAAHALKAQTAALDAAPEASPESDITIAARLRPLLPDEVGAGQVAGVFARPGAGGVAELHEMRRPVRPTAPLALSSSSYTVDRVFGPDSATEDIYTRLVRPLVPWAWSGGMSTLFAYGQTGSGKTYTVSALECLIAHTLFSGDLDGARDVYISVIELAGKSAFDLLQARKPVSILEDSFGSTHFAGAADVRVQTGAELLAQIEAAAAFRRTEPTLKNATSSRSHAICKIRLANPALPQADEGVLYLVDLAGSEAARDKSAHTAERMKEARDINTSLSVLKDCIRGRAAVDLAGTGKPAYVPFRQTPLTRVLKHVFDPAAERACRTTVVACINPSFLDVGASKSTLRYAALLKGAPPKPQVVRYDPARPSSWDNAQLRAWVATGSGTPAVDAALLAPTETGKQLLSLPAPEFITRCLKTPGVSTEQAVAFQSKFWGMHIDSARSVAFKKGGSGRQTPADGADDSANGDSVHALTAHMDKLSQGLCSAEADPARRAEPFHTRLRPGMVVAWTPPEGVRGLPVLAGRNLAMLLAPGEDGAWTAAIVCPAVLPGAFEVFIWQQFSAAADRFVAEVILEYDVGSRYYYETV